MAVISINKKEFLILVGKKLSDEFIEERLSMLGVSVENINESEIVVDVLANRPDLLSNYGLVRAFSNFLGLINIKDYEVKKSNYLIYTKRTANEWPYCVTAVVKNLKLDDEKIKEIIQMQEKLGATFLRNRKSGGLGIYPLDKIKFPVTYTSEIPEKIKFRPLEYPYPINGKEILEKHPAGKEYKNIVQGWRKFPFFIDANNVVMSMPPIINSHDLGNVTEETKNVFVEATGTDLNTINTALNILVTCLADMGGEIYSTKLVYKNKNYNTPDLKPREISIDENYVNKILGSDLKVKNMRDLLLRMGYIKGKKEDIVLVPAYRSDILHQIDLVEDVAISYGYDKFKEEIPNVSTIAEESGFDIFKRKVANILVGLGLVEVHTNNLTSKGDQSYKMNFDIKSVELANALNEEYNVFRAWLVPSFLHILKENKHYEYPQNLFGYGDVFKYDAKQQTGIGEAVRLCVILCHSNVNFTNIKQVLDVIIRALDLKYEIREVDHGSFIPGRVGRISVHNLDVAYIGEIHPKVLEEFKLEMPVAALELNLTELFKLFK